MIIKAHIHLLWLASQITTPKTSKATGQYFSSNQLVSINPVEPINATTPTANEKPRYKDTSIDLLMNVRKYRYFDWTVKTGNEEI
jgi:hypothetical protein